MGPPLSNAPLKPRLIVSGCLSLIAGYSDVVSYLLFHEFAGMQSGNMVFLGSVLLSDTPTDAFFNIAVMASNMAGVMLFSLLKETRPETATRDAAPMCAGLTAMAEVLNGVVGSSKWNVCFLAASLGAQNYLSFSGKIGGMTSLATGNLQKTAKGIFKLVYGLPFDQPERDSTLVALIVVLGTISGALLGAAALKHTAPFGHRWLLAPLAVLQLIILTFHDKAFKGSVKEPKNEPLLVEDEESKDADGPAVNPLST